MSSDMHWRDLINRYLMACQEDYLAAARVESNEQRILFSCASTELRQRIANQRTEFELRSIHPLSPADSYVLVHETPDYVVAEIDSHPSGCPLLKSRFRVVRQGNAWILDDIYWKCPCDDGKCYLCDDGTCKYCSRGHCSYCHGTGSYKCWIFFTRSCILCDGSGSCHFCKGKGICDSCDGTGKCTSCCDSDIPGWNSRFTNRQVKPKNKA